ncbi:MAG: glycosyltransferase [Planctomycetes bacterium]|nr:glycosyltransferase [Planctomycetota bacterium]
MDVCLLSSQPWGEVHRTNRHHVAETLAGIGHRVLFVEPVYGPRPRLGQAGDRLWFARAGRLLPANRPRLVHRINLRHAERNLLRACRSWMGSLGFSRPVFWTYRALAPEFLSGLDGDPLLFDYVDHDHAMGVEGGAVPPLPDALASTFDRAVLVVTSNDILRGDLARWPNVRTAENVGAIEPFLPSGGDGVLPDTPPRILFAGALDLRKIDGVLVETLVRRSGGRYRWLFLGRIEGHPGYWRRLARHSGVEIRPPVPLADVAPLARGAHRLVFPYARNAYTRTCFPLKFFEYLATGRPVVGAPLPALAPYERFYLACEGPEAWLRALEEEPAVPARERIAEARRHTYRARVGRILDLLDCEGIS